MFLICFAGKQFYIFACPLNVTACVGISAFNETGKAANDMILQLINFLIVELYLFRLVGNLLFQICLHVPNNICVES